MDIIKTFTVQIPTWAMCYLFNADDSGLDANDLDTVKEWQKSTDEETAREHGADAQWQLIPPDADAETYWAPFPAFGKACDVQECHIAIIKKGA